MFALYYLYHSCASAVRCKVAMPKVAHCPSGGRRRCPPFSMQALRWVSKNWSRQFNQASGSTSPREFHFEEARRMGIRSLRDGYRQGKQPAISACVLDSCCTPVSSLATARLWAWTCWLVSHRLAEMKLSFLFCPLNLCLLSSKRFMRVMSMMLIFSTSSVVAKML